MKIQKLSILLFSIIFTFSSFTHAETLIALPDSSSLSAGQDSSQEQQTQEVLYLNGAKAQKVKLSNNLEAILISSPTSKKATAALGIKVGSEDDPLGKEGLAHYLEHMLFLGTQEYPAANEYKKFMTENNGGSNASTAGFLTRYYFEISPKAYDEALHRFSRFFVSPLFDANFSEQEKKAVENEFHHRRDQYKTYRAQTPFINDGIGNFSVGSLETLGNVTVEDTKAFFKEHYFAEAMTLVLIAPFPLNELESFATKYFSSIPSKSEQPLNSYQAIDEFELQHLPVEVLVAQEKGEKALTIMFPLPEAKLWNSTSLRVISKILGDEYSGSLMDQLQKKGWLPPGPNQLSASAYLSQARVSVQLTEKGFQERESLVKAVISYIENVKKQPYQEYLAQEVLNLDEGGKKVESYFDIGSSLASGLLGALYRPSLDPPTWKEALIGEEPEPGSEQEYKSYLNSLVLDKPLVTVLHPSIQEVEIDYTPYTQMEKGGVYLDETTTGQKVVVDSVFGWAYAVNEIDLNMKDTPLYPASIPAPNPYIPTSFEYFSYEALSDFVAQDDFGIIRMNRFLDNPLPVATFSAALFSKNIDGTETDHTLFLKMLSRLINHQYISNFYNASGAGYSLTATPSSVRSALIFEFNGWSSGFISTFNDVLKGLELESNAALFNQVRDLAVRDAKMALQDGPVTTAISTLSATLNQAGLRPAQEVAALEAYTYEQYLTQLQSFKQSMAMIGNISGNVKKEFSSAIPKALSQSWNITWDASNNPEMPLLQFSNNLDQMIDLDSPSQDNGAYVAYWNFGPSEYMTEKDFYTMIIAPWFSRDYYHELRTIQQLAYSLGSFKYDRFQQSGLAYYIQSPHPMETIQTQSDVFFKKWVGEFNDTFDQSDLDRAVSNLAELYEFPAENGARHSLLFTRQLSGQGKMIEYDEIMSVLEKITIEDLSKFLTDRIDEGSKPDISIRVSK